MNKKVKWGIIIFIGAGLIGWGIYSQLPKENKELAAADKVMSSNRNGKKALDPKVFPRSEPRLKSL